MTNSANSSKTGSATGKFSATTQTSEALARTLRNSEDYDDWDYGTEPIPHDTSWAQSSSSVLNLYARVLQLFQEAETVNMGRLAAIAVTEILSVPSETLLRLSKTFIP
jgi:hypothetical protein